MIRLGLLMLATVFGLYAVLSLYGGENLRSARRPAPPPLASAAQDAGNTLQRPEPAGSLPAEVPAEVVPVASQTPEQVVRFPGPALEPSPEYAGNTPEDAAAAAAGAAVSGETLFVTGDRVNMRAGPGTQNPVVSSLGRGAPLVTLGPVDADWVHVRAADGQEGYISASLLSAAAP